MYLFRSHSASLDYEIRIFMSLIRLRRILITSSRLDRNLHPASYVNFRVYTSVLTNLESNPSQAATEGRRPTDKRETDPTGMLCWEIYKQENIYSQVTERHGVYEMTISSLPDRPINNNERINR